MRISKLFINRQVADHPTTRSIQSRLKVPSESVQSAQQVYAAISEAADPVQKGKEILYLTRNKGAS